jgi:RNA polymerase sigma-70 factor (ECF subfamily)
MRSGLAACAERTLHFAVASRSRLSDARNLAEVEREHGMHELPARDSHAGDADAARSLEQREERALLERLRAGEPEAFGTLVRRHGAQMLAVARRLLSHEDDAREVVQDAFLSAFRAVASFEGGSRLGTWLHRITVNAALMKLRQRRRRHEEPIDAYLPGFLADGHQARPAEDWRRSAQEILSSREDRQYVLDCIERMPESYREVLKLRDIEELSTQETAELLSIEPNTVKVRLHRARQALRALLDARFRGNR